MVEKNSNMMRSSQVCNKVPSNTLRPLEIRCNDPTEYMTNLYSKTFFEGYLVSILHSMCSYWGSKENKQFLFFSGIWLKWQNCSMTCTTGSHPSQLYKLDNRCGTSGGRGRNDNNIESKELAPGKHFYMKAGSRISPPIAILVWHQLEQYVLQSF